MGQNLERVRERIAEAAQRAGRDPRDVELIAISKGSGIDVIGQAMSRGQRHFGENRLQELMVKAKALPSGLQWHFVGRLQSNKVSKLLECRPVIHSVDRLQIGQEIDRKAKTPTQALIQVNVSGEPSKAGVTPSEAPRFTEAVLSLSNLELLGLMTLAPLTASPEAVRGYFKALADLKEKLEREIPGLTIHHLSMGMSQDYVVAVEEGATMVRIGEAIFGKRRDGRSGIR